MLVSAVLWVLPGLASVQSEHGLHVKQALVLRAQKTGRPDAALRVGGATA